jgi:DinB superfamily
MTHNGLPCLDLLEATPGILRGLMAELTEDDACWKPAPDRFSVAEVLAHLSHSEGHCYRMRLDRFVGETRPTFEPDDAQMYLDLYRGADPEDVFDHFEEQRQANVDYLRGLPPEVGGRVALHQEAGEITWTRCSTSGRFTIWVTFGRLRNSCAPESICMARGHWGSATDSNRKAVARVRVGFLHFDAQGSDQFHIMSASERRRGNIDEAVGGTATDVDAAPVLSERMWAADWPVPSQTLPRSRSPASADVCQGG